MALSGTIYGSTSNQYITAKIEWSATQSVSANTSTITATLYYCKSSASTSATYGTLSGRIYIGSSYTSYSKTVTLNTNNTYVSVGSYKLTVTHDNDGTKDIDIWATGAISGTTLTSTTFSEAARTVSLTTIPRAAILNSLSCSTNYLDGTITYQYTPTTTSYYIRGNLSLNINGTFTTIKTDNNGKPSSTTKKSQTITLNNEQLSTIYNKLPNVSKGTLRLTLHTYSDAGYSNQIGDAMHKEIELTIPTSVKPKVGALTLTPSTITLLNTQTGANTTNTTNLLVQGKNKLTLTASSTSAGAGSKIAYYTFNGYNSSGTLFYTKKVTSTSASQSLAISPISNTGTLKFQVTATDARGRTSAVVEKSITCYAYSKPSISSFSVSRSTVDGVNYLKCTYSATYASVNSVNAATVTMHYNNSSVYGSGGSASANIGSDISSTYKVYLTIRDKFGGYVTTATKTVYGETRVMNVTADGTGVAFGKMAERNNFFESRWPIVTGSRFGCNGAYGDQAFNIYCQWADGENHDILVRGTDGKSIGLGWVGSDTYETSLDVRPKKVNVRGTLTAPRGRFTATTDVAVASHNDVPLRVGDDDGVHLDIDGNEIQCKSSTTESNPLYLNNDGGDVYTHGFRIPEIQHGRIAITPSAANTPTTKIVTFGQQFSGTPTVTTTPVSSVPGTTVLGTSVVDPSATQVSICLTRSNTTQTSVEWIAIY